MPIGMKGAASLLPLATIHVALAAEGKRSVDAGMEGIDLALDLTNVLDCHHCRP